MPYRPKEPENYRDEEWLREKYHVEGLSTSDIGDLCDCTKETIRRWLDRHDIDARSKSEAAKIRVERHPHTKLDPDQMGGYNPWDHWDEEEREEFRQWLSEERQGEGNPLYEVTGEDHPQWNEDYDPKDDPWFYHNVRWKEARKQALDRDGHECQKCGNVEDLHVHHTIPVEDGGAPYETKNLLTLCAGCHASEHQ